MLGRGTESSHRWRGVVAVAGVVAIAVLGAWIASRAVDEPDPRAGSVRLDDAPGLFEVGEPVEAYRVDYRVESRGSGDTVVTSDRLLVRRPFEARLESYSGPVPTGDPSSVQVESFGALFADGADSDEVIVAVPPGPPGSDTRVLAGLADALDEDRFELGERRRILDRTCQVVRTVALLATADLAPPAGQDHAETCIDSDGLVLEELLVADGAVLLRRVAIDVELDPIVDDTTFEVGDQSVPVESGGGFLAETEPDSRQPGPFFESSAPSGFERLGRYVVIPPQQENFSDPLRRGNRLTYLSDVFVDGASVVVLDQGGTFGNVDPFPDREGIEVEIEGLGSALLSYGRNGPTVLVPRAEGKFLRARGTVEPAVLVELLEGLEEVEGGELRLRDG